MSSNDALVDNVRSAVATELTTLPTYLYPCWSIKPMSDGGSAAGQAARTNIMAVVLEEMLHMGLASNLLNALGGTPCFTEPPYLPEFPGKLLRTVDNPDGWGVDVDLLPLDEAAIDMMCHIELPSWDDPEGPTIGEFYEEYVEGLLPTDDAAYAGGRQLAPWDNPGAGRLFAVTSQATATDAITEILDQGEGLNQNTHDDGYHELAHYWRFEEVRSAIRDGRLKPATDVYPVIASPRTNLGSYTPEQRRANDAFNQSYSRMLDALQATLSSPQPDVYPVATGMMEQLQHQAALLRNTGTVPGTQFAPGPTFEYVAEQG